MITRKKIIRGASTIIQHTRALSGWRAVATQVDRAIAPSTWYPFPRRGGLVLMFHRIAVRPDPFRPGFDVGLFKRLCRLLARHYDVLPLEAMERRRIGHGDLSRAVALTFDDGFADNYRVALPILRKYDLPATVFVTTGAVGDKVPLWFSRVAWIVEHAQPVAPVPDAVDDVIIRLATHNERLKTAERLVDRLRLWAPPKRDTLLDQLQAQLRVPSDAPGLHRDMVTWDELREMDKAGFCAQPHTVTHPILAGLSPENLQHELVAAKATLEQKLDRPAEIFAYPRGCPEDFSSEVTDAVRRAGYRLAYTTAPAAVRPSDEPLALPRVTLYAETPAAMAVQLERLFYLRSR